MSPAWAYQACAEPDDKLPGPHSGESAEWHKLLHRQLLGLKVCTLQPSTLQHSNRRGRYYAAPQSGGRYYSEPDPDAVQAFRHSSLPLLTRLDCRVVALDRWAQEPLGAQSEP